VVLCVEDDVDKFNVSHSSIVLLSLRMLETTAMLGDSVVHVGLRFYIQQAGVFM